MIGSGRHQRTFQLILAVIVIAGLVVAMLATAFVPTISR